LNIRPAKRLEKMSSAIFTEMMIKKKELLAKGIDVIDLGIGSPDKPPHPEIIQSFKEAVSDPVVYNYPDFQGNDLFRQSIADWYRFRFGVDLDPKKGEVLVLMGSQDGLAHLAQSFIDEGDIVLIPDPGYPIYSISVQLAGGIVYPMPLLEENDYLPDFKQIPVDILKKTKLMILNYPSNPLSATATIGFFEEVVKLAKEFEIIIAHDNAYSEMAFDGFKPPSFLEIDGAKDIGVEFNSLSKSFNIAGARIGYVVGNAKIINPLKVLKSYIDFGVFEAVQRVATDALRRDITNPNETYRIYQDRRDVVIKGLHDIGWNIKKPKATMFIWAPIPVGWKSLDFALTLLERTGVVVIPGDAFGKYGEGYVRIGMVQDTDRLMEAVERIAQSGILFERGN